MGEPRPFGYEMVDRIYTEDGWRNTTYRRADQSTFQVLLPWWENPSGEQAPGRRFHDERAEHEMALRLNASRPEDSGS